jgi:acyl-CoA synthetase (AMP-forming)/AMP-acid ligase II
MAVHRIGAASILMPKFDAEAALRLIETHRVTHAQFVPTMFVRMLCSASYTSPHRALSTSSTR